MMQQPRKGGEEEVVNLGHTRSPRAACEHEHEALGSRR